MWSEILIEEDGEGTTIKIKKDRIIWRVLNLLNKGGMLSLESTKNGAAVFVLDGDAKILHVPLRLARRLILSPYITPMSPDRARITMQGRRVVDKS